MRKFCAVALSLACGLLLSSTLSAQAKSLTLYGFEPGEAKPAEANGETVKEHATQGEYAFKMTTLPDGYAGFRITDRKLLSQFKGYVLLKADIFNPQNDPVPYALRIDDSKSTGYGSRYNDENFLAPPGQSMLELNITSLLRSNSKNFGARDMLDAGAITLVNLFMSPNKKPVTIYIDNLRIESSGLRAVEGLRAFDFGPAKAAVYPGFEGVNEKMPYDAERGYGWNNCESSDRVYTPDDLTADFLRGGSFTMDLPNGSYEVNVCIDPYGAWHRFPSFSWRKLTLNGKTVLDEKMNGDDFLDTAYYMHEDDEDLPGDNIWAKYIMRRNVSRRFTAEVADGKLTMSLDADGKYGKPVCFMVVYPVAKLAEGRKWMDDLDAVRRERFNRNLYVIVPKPRDPQPGFVAGVPIFLFGRPTEEDITVREGVPKDEVMNPKPLALEAAQGERENVQFGICPVAAMKDVTVTVSDLRSEKDALIRASAVEVRHARNFLKHMGRMRAGTILPYILMDFKTLDLAPGITRSIWLTITIPEYAAPGTYAGTVRVGNTGMAKTLPITVTVLPFKLEKAKSMALSVTGATAGHWDYWFPETRERWWKVADAVMKDMADHGMNAVTGGPGARIRLRNIQPPPDIDYSDMDRWLALAVKHGLTMPGDSYQGLDVVNMPKDTRDLNANEKIARQQFGLSYSELVQEVFADVEKHAKEKGWPPRSYSLLDEPRVEFGNIESAGKLAEIFIKAAPNTRFSGYYTPGQGREAYFGKLPVNISHFSTQAIELTRKYGTELWDYDGSGVRYNIGRWAFAAGKAGLKGFMRNGYMYVNSDPYFDFSDDEASWCVVYPSKRDTVNASVGWERTAQGVNDFRYLEMLDGLIRKAGANNFRGTAEAIAAKTWLDKTLAPINLEHRESANLTPEEFRAFKHECAMHIVALKKALGE